ncbi:MAG: flagellar basal body-associated FliL family protein [Deltaproteobacteria bacterium]|nr:flagellar basal body-associated FliL family protein [Deltaproteobacteria bacterium]
MVDEDEKPQQAAADASAPAKKKSKLPLILSAVVLLAGSGAAAWYLGVLPFSKKRHAEATAAVEEKAGEEGHGAKGEKGPGPILPLETFIANLADEGGSRYLKATFQVEFLGASVPPDVNGRLPQIRDLLLTLLSSKSFEDVRTLEGKQQLREEIIGHVNQVLDRDAVKAVYFTEFIVQ